MRIQFLALALAACQVSPSRDAADALDLEAARRHMVEHAVRQAGVTEERVLDSMMRTPRHEFVPAEMLDRAYHDAGVPIGEGQTISSPFIVAFMTEALETEPTDRVLEIGTGSGYQAAVLSPLVKDVYSIEIVESLGARAAKVLAGLGYANVHTKVGDGYLGWEEHAPFDKIIVTCSPEEVPAPLIEQLREGGMVVIPVGERHQQQLCRMVKRDGALVSSSLRPTLFVPMTGAAEANRRIFPDPGRPALVNGDFEADLDENQRVPGWYYQRRLKLVDSDDAPSGKRFVSFFADASNENAHLMQGLAIDGREVQRVDFSASVACLNAQQGPTRDQAPLAGITFYDENRRALNSVVLGPVFGSHGFKELRLTGIRVPETAREAIVRIGLFGATGDVWFDDVRVRASEAGGS